MEEVQYEKYRTIIVKEVGKTAETFIGVNFYNDTNSGLYWIKVSELEERYYSIANLEYIKIFRIVKG